MKRSLLLGIVVAGGLSSAAFAGTEAADSYVLRHYSQGQHAYTVLIRATQLTMAQAPYQLTGKEQGGAQAPKSKTPAYIPRFDKGGIWR